MAQPARRRRAEAEVGLIFGLIGALEGLSQHRLIDRLIRGRIWIGLVAFALIGIVTLQLGLLRLNGGIGRALEHEAMLQRENAALSIENSELAAGERIVSRAARLGMVDVPSGALQFRAAHPHSDAAKAAAVLSSSARSSSEGAEEAASASTTAGESSGSQASESSESSESAESQSSAESSTAASSGSGESPSSESEESAPSAESSAPATTESAASGSGEASPAGGIQAGSGGE